MKVYEKSWKKKIRNRRKNKEIQFQPILEIIELCQTGVRSNIIRREDPQRHGTVKSSEGNIRK